MLNLPGLLRSASKITMAEASSKLPLDEKLRKAKAVMTSPKARRVGAWAAGLFLAFGVFGFVAAPPLVKSLLLDQLSQQLPPKVADRA